MLNLLLEGGAAGHMNHLYDNGNLTFSKIKEIFNAAAEGKLEGSEKTDGQNLMISYSVTENKAKGVRNKSEIKSGGLNADQMSAKFASHANPQLKNTFKEAIINFEKAVNNLSDKEKIELFGPDTNIFYNAEVMDPRTPNVINYDTKTLVLHPRGHIEFDRKEQKVTGRDLSKELSKLENAIINTQEQIKQDNYSVQTTSIRRLKALSDKKPLYQANSKINSLLSSVNSLIKSDSLKLNDSSTIDEYMIARVYILINSILQKEKIKLDPVAKMNIAKRILGVKGISIKDISVKISKEQIEFVKEHFLNEASKKEILKTAIMPLELIVNEFAVEMLKGLQSVFIIDNAKEVKRLRGELQKAIQAIESSGNEEAMTILKQQMTKLKSADTVDSAAEGFVFDYDGVTYKFTGNFAPMNQILGLFKYGRGNVEALKEAKKLKQETITIFAGAFKPPHKGHLKTVKDCLKKSDKLILLISPLSRDVENKGPFTSKMSKNLWNIYLQAEGIADKVSILDSEYSPVRTVYQFIENKENNPNFAQEGQHIILAVGDDDVERYDQNSIKKHAKPGVTVSVSVIKRVASATGMREAISTDDLKKLKTFLPDSVDKNAVSKLILDMFKTKQNVSENIIYDIIKESISFCGKYSLLRKRK